LVDRFDKGVQIRRHAADRRQTLRLPPRQEGGEAVGTGTDQFPFPLIHQASSPAGRASKRQVRSPLAQQSTSLTMNSLPV